MFRTLLFLGCCLWVWGCTAETAAPDEFTLPGLGGKADISDQVNLLGAVEFGGEVSGEIVDDLQYDAYVFSARAEAVVTTEITNRGSSRSLDDVIMVYGPGSPDGGYGDAERLASDNDSGWGAHARIRDLVIPEQGSYLIIVGAADGQGRGNYRLTLECESGDCAPSAGDVTMCDGSILGWGELCVDARVGDDGLSWEAAFEDCMDEDEIMDHIIDACEWSATPPTYCSAGVDRLRAEMVPACRQTLGFELALVGGPLDPSATAAFADWAEAQTAASLSSLRETFDGEDGVRSVRESAYANQADALYPNVDARELAELHPEWESVLSYENDFDGFTEWVELEWELISVEEVWANGSVIGVVGYSSATVSYWDPSDPDDPVNESFDAYVLVNGAEQVVRNVFTQ